MAVYLPLHKDHSSIINPLNGEKISVNGSIYRQLLESGHIKEFTNPKIEIADQRTRSQKRKGIPLILPTEKICCTENKCDLEGYVCCIHGDTRQLILAGKITYAYHPIYIDGDGNYRIIDYEWKHYCPHCVSQCRRDQEVKDIRSVIKVSDDEDCSAQESTTVEVDH